MIAKEPDFTPRLTTGGPAAQRRQPVLDPVYSQDRMLNSATRAVTAANQSAESIQEPQLFPDLANDPGDSGPEIPPSPTFAGSAAERASSAREERPGRSRPLLWAGILSVSAFAIVVPLLLLMNQSERTVVADADLPVVAPESGPEKVRPADEGGMQPANQDVAIYDSLTGEAKSQTEVLLGQPEAPMPLPMPPPAPVEAAPDVDAPGPNSANDIPQVPAPAFDVTDQAAAAASSIEPGAGGGTAAETTQETPQAPAASTITDVVEQTASLGDGYRVQVAAVKTKDGAQLTWDKLQKKHSQLLGGLALTVVEIDKGTEGKFYRVQGGPFADRAAATDVCVALKKLEQGCMVVKP